MFIIDRLLMIINMIPMIARNSPAWICSCEEESSLGGKCFAAWLHAAAVHNTSPAELLEATLEERFKTFPLNQGEMRISTCMHLARHALGLHPYAPHALG
jgi:hypothetical protein